MNPISKKLSAIAEEKGISVRTLEQRTGIPKSAIHRYLSGDIVKIPVDRLQALATAMGVSPGYFLGIERKDGSLLTNLEVESNLNKVSTVNRHQVRLISKVAAGQPIPAEENWDMVDSPFDADYALTIDGDSMEPEFLDGDIVYIRAQEDVYDGGIAVVMIDNESSTLKRIYHIRNGLQLISLNPKYAPMVFLSDADEPARVRVLGVPVGYARRFHS